MSAFVAGALVTALKAPGVLRLSEASKAGAILNIEQVAWAVDTVPVDTVKVTIVSCQTGIARGTLGLVSIANSAAW